MWLRLIWWRKYLSPIPRRYIYSRSDLKSPRWCMITIDKQWRNNLPRDVRGSSWGPYCRTLSARLTNRRFSLRCSLGIKVSRNLLGLNLVSNQKCLPYVFRRARSCRMKMRKEKSRPQKQWAFPLSPQQKSDLGSLILQHLSNAQSSSQRKMPSWPITRIEYATYGSTVDTVLNLRRIDARIPDTTVGMISKSIALSMICWLESFMRLRDQDPTWSYKQSWLHWVGITLSRPEEPGKNSRCWGRAWDIEETVYATGWTLPSDVDSLRCGRSSRSKQTNHSRAKHWLDDSKAKIEDYIKRVDGMGWRV